MIPMNRLDLPYVLVTATLGVALFCAGRWTAPSPVAHAVYVQEAPIVQAPVELIPPPPPAPKVTPVTTVDSLPVYTEAPAAPAWKPSDMINDALLPVIHPSASASARPAPPVVAAAPVVKPAPAPMPIVLEEIPDNPYSHKKKAVATTPGF